MYNTILSERVEIVIMAGLQHHLKSSCRVAVQNHCNSFQEHRKLPITGEIMYGFYAAVTLCPYNPSPEFKDLVGRGKNILI